MKDIKWSSTFFTVTLITMGRCFLAQGGIIFLPNFLCIANGIRHYKDKLSELYNIDMLPNHEMMRNPLFQASNGLELIPGMSPCLAERFQLSLIANSHAPCAVPTSYFWRLQLKSVLPTILAGVVTPSREFHRMNTIVSPTSLTPWYGQSTPFSP